MKERKKKLNVCKSTYSQKKSTKEYEATKKKNFLENSFEKNLHLGKNLNDVKNVHIKRQVKFKKSY